jgi:hypothetical protein
MKPQVLDFIPWKRWIEKRSAKMAKNVTPDARLGTWPYLESAMVHSDEISVHCWKDMVYALDLYSSARESESVIWLPHVIEVFEAAEIRKRAKKRSNFGVLDLWMAEGNIKLSGGLLEENFGRLEKGLISINWTLKFEMNQVNLKLRLSI